MKRNILYTCLVAFIGILSFSSCNDDDDNIQIEADLAGHFIGSFDGDVRIDSIQKAAENVTIEPGTIYRHMYSVPTSNSITFTITKAEGNNVNITFEDFYFQGMSFDLEIPNVKVGRLYDTYTLQGESTLTIAPLGECNVSITGSAYSATVGCTVSITAPELPTTEENVGKGFLYQIEFTFISKQTTGNESNEARLETFEFPTSVGANENAELEGGIIDHENKTILFTCKQGEDLNRLKPTITVSPEETATVYPASESEVNFEMFNGKYIFSVVAEDGTRTNYTVIITPREEEATEG